MKKKTSYWWENERKLPAEKRERESNEGGEEFFKSSSSSHSSSYINKTLNNEWNRFSQQKPLHPLLLLLCRTSPLFLSSSHSHRLLLLFPFRNSPLIFSLPIRFHLQIWWLSIPRNMLGGLSNGNPGFPACAEGNFQYDMSALPQLQLFGEVPVGDPINYIGNENATEAVRPMKRVREPEPTFMQRKLHISLNSNFCQDEAGRAGSILNPTPVSTGLRLSYEEDERNSSVTSASENTKAVHLNNSLFSNVKIEIDRQKEQLEHYFRLQERNLVKGVRELNQIHAASFLNALEKGVGKKLHEKDVEIENINCKNKELGEKIKQVAMEAQSWQYRAKYNESIVNALKSNLQQVIALGAVQGREGFGDSDVDDAASYHNNLSGPGNPVNVTKRLRCRVCDGKEVSILLLPCRHLCLCKDCEGFTDTCPVCQVVRTANVHVFMS